MQGRIFGVAVAALAYGSTANAQVTAVVTESTATVSLSNGTTVFSGDNLSGSLNGTDLSGGSYDSTSSVDGPEIVFKNGNISAGNFATVSSITSLDISFTNDTGAALRPRLTSTILPAGLGLLVTDGCGTGPVRMCGETGRGGVSFLDLPSALSGSNNSNRIAMAGFDFRIFSGEREVYGLTGSVSLLYDFETEQNILVTDLGAAGNALTGFKQITYEGRPTALAFGWDATQIGFELPDELAAGASSTLRYVTKFTTFSRSPRAQDGCSSALAFGEFGDPVGRGGSIPPPALAASALAAPAALGSEDGCGGSGGAFTLPPPRASTFRFARPTFRNGTLDIQLLPPFGGTVPEPASWALMLGGFGLAGAALRRKRAVTTA